MTSVLSQEDTHLMIDAGPTLQCAIAIANLGLATTINANSNITSNVILTNGYKLFAFGITSSQAGTVSIQRYLDTAGTISQGAAITGTLTANTALTVNSNDGLPFQSIQMTVSNSAGSAATISNVLLLLQSD